MDKNFRDSSCLVPEGTIRLILEADAQVLAKPEDRARFVNDNKTEYFIAVNTWMLIVREYSPYAWKYLLNRIVNDGLAATIRWTDQFAQELVAGGGLPQSGAEYTLLTTIYLDVIRSCERMTNFKTEDSLSLTPHQIFLTILRYLKRMSPNSATILEEVAIDSFYANQKRLKGCDRGILPYNSRLVLELVRDEVDKLDIQSRISAFSQMDIHDLKFTPGAAYDSKADLGSKLKAMYTVCPEYFRNTEHFVSAFFPIYMGRTLDHVRLQAVPKNIKTARTIAMENTYRQAVAKRMFDIWQNTLPTAIQLHDQTVNQRLAHDGSITADLATIDLKSASDSVRYSLVRSIYPNEFCEYLDLVRPRIVDCDGRQPTYLISWATMGNSLTFILESEIFYLICEAAVAFHERHFGPVKNRTISVYGDDLIVPSEACQTVIAFLSALGFIVNTDKTFDTGYYRESCGKEYMKGEDWSSLYFPRFPISNNLLNANRDSRADVWSTDFSRLVELQHRLFSISHDASYFLAQFLLDKKPRLSVSRPGRNPHAVWGLDVKWSAIRLYPLHCLVSHRFFDVYRFRTIRAICKIEIPVKETDPAVLDARKRYYNCIPVAVYADTFDPLMEKYLYIQFLKNGPRYQDDLDRLLGVSTPNLRKDLLHPHFVWRDVEDTDIQ